ncbi:MAG: serine/threonine protein kinase [Verrucomicrobiae bacterium]|nr:serine/threonine protein kinase [Verrucomicrobiae bacterium]
MNNDIDSQGKDCRICDTCGTLIPSQAPGGYCPVCLLNADTLISPPHSPQGTYLPKPEANDPDTGREDKVGTESATPSPPIPEFALPVEELQTLFPDLEILKLLGAGGMGAVYQARQPRLDRLAALKVLSCPPELHENFSLRFEREAQVLARLDHPNIVTIFDFGEIEPDGERVRSLFWFLMEFVDGADLNQLIRTKKLTPEHAFPLVPQICDALQYAHDEGITHRDIKPANILVNHKGRVKIADFGLARLIDGEATADAMMTGLTLTGTSMGTPHYMAPEQWETPEKVDHRADIYSLGVVIYEMLTGERPAGVFDPPSRKVQVDVRIDEVVLKAMEKEPERRYQQASHMKEDVTRVVEEPRKAPRMKRKASGKRFPIFTSTRIATVLALVVVGGYYGWKKRGTAVEKESQPVAMTSTHIEDTVSQKWSGNEITTKAAITPKAESPLFAYAEPGRLNLWSFGEEYPPAMTHAEGITDFVQIRARGNRWLALRADGSLLTSDRGEIAKNVRALLYTGGGAYSEDLFYLTTEGTLDSLNGSASIRIDGEIRDLAAKSDHKGDYLDIVVVRTDGTVHFQASSKPGARKTDDEVEAYLRSAWRVPPKVARSGAVGVRTTADITMVEKEDGRFVLWSRDRKPVFAPEGTFSIAMVGSKACALLSGGRLKTADLLNQGNTEWKDLDFPVSPRVVEAVGVRTFGGDFVLRFPDDSYQTLGLEIPERERREVASQQIQGMPLCAWDFAEFRTDGKSEKQYRNGALLWIESSQSKIPGLPELATHPRGSLRAVGSGPYTTKTDTSRADPYDDFVNVAGSPDFWVGLRANGETISSDGSLNADGIARLSSSFHTHAVLISNTGKLVFREDKAQEQPSEIAGVGFVDAAISHHHGIALDEDGRAHVFGEYYEKAIDDGLGAAGYGTPRWPAPPEEALTDVQAVTVAHTHAATLKKDGSLRVFGWEGLVELPSNVTSKTFTQIASSPDQVCLLDSEGSAWRFGLARNPQPNQPVGHAGKLLKMVNEEATAVGDDTWRDADGRWHSIENAVDSLLAENLPGDVPHFIRKWKSSEGENASLFWIDPELVRENQAKAEPPKLELPPALAAMRQRGGRLRSWTSGSEPLTGLELAEGIDDFVRCDGIAYPGSDRWLAIRADGPSVTPLADFERSGELVSLDTHLGVLRSGEILTCFKDHPRKLVPADVIDAKYASSSKLQFELLLNRDGTVEVNRAPPSRDWLDDELPETRMKLDAVTDAVKIVAVGNGSGMVLQKSGEVIAWNPDGALPSDVEISDAVDIAIGGLFWAALRADGRLHIQDRHVKSPVPSDLGPAFAVRAYNTVAAAQMSDGTWRAWGNDQDSGLIQQIEGIGPAVDIRFNISNEGDRCALLWIEPFDQ